MSIEVRCQDWERLDEFLGDIIAADKLVGSHSGYEIRLGMPNGGILCVSVISPEEEVYFLYTEFFDADLYGDEDWHVEQAKKLIDHLEGVTSCPGQLPLNLGV
ncbi:MAG: hypothetical protein F6K21_05680 [Symploca sp. SIO2D2]|nr:hypothetical protein [Symploca sp. SIO2D2]